MLETFWVDAVNIAVYLINRGSLVPLEFKLLEEVWTGKELKYSHLRTFGCNAYVRVDLEKSDTLDVEVMVLTHSSIGFGMTRTKKS